MKIKHTRHEGWAIKELQRIADYNKVMSEQFISVDSLIRFSVYKFIIENRKNKIGLDNEFIKEIGLKAWKECS